MFNFYDFGIAADNKALEATTLAVTPLTVVPLLNGELGIADQSLEVEGVDFDGNSYSDKLADQNAITCKWLQWGSNRSTPPDVRRGERILIYRAGDSASEFYWVCPGLDDHLRRLETVVYLWNADPDGLSDTPSSVDNSYSLVVSTHKKQLTFQTTQLNGEPFQHTLQLDAEKGIFTYADNVGNGFNVESGENTVRLENADKTTWHLERGHLKGYAPETATIEAVESITLKTKVFTLNASESVTVNTKATLIDSTDSVTIKTAKTTIDAPETEITGNVQTGGNVIVGGTLDVTGKMSASAGGTFGGVTIENGKISCEGIDSTGPVNAPNI